MVGDKKSRNDGQTTLKVLKKRVQNFANRRDWEKYHNPKDLAIAINVEAAELLDLFKWKLQTDVINLKQDEIFDRIREESADIMIYLLHLANVLSMDLTKSVLEKMEKNEQKYPAEDPKTRNKW